MPVKDVKDTNNQLQRFVDAQDRLQGGKYGDATIFEVACLEMLQEQKRTHWMWFIFPQLRGLSPSTTGTHYGLRGIEETIAFMCHPVLQNRYRACVGIVNNPKTIESFSEIDKMKLRSSLSLFYVANGSPENIYLDVLDCMGWDLCDKTLELLGMI